MVELTLASYQHAKFQVYSALLDNRRLIYQRNELVAQAHRDTENIVRNI